MSQLGSTGVFFTAPAPVDGLPVLPGRLVESVGRAARIMVGKFRDCNDDLHLRARDFSPEPVLDNIRMLNNDKRHRKP